MSEGRTEDTRLADERGEVTVRFTVETLEAFITLLNESDIRSPVSPEYRLIFTVRTVAPGEALIESFLTRVERANEERAEDTRPRLYPTVAEERAVREFEKQRAVVRAAEAPPILDEPCGACGRTWRDDGASGNKAESRYARNSWHQMKYGHAFVGLREPVPTHGGDDQQEARLLEAAKWAQAKMLKVFGDTDDGAGLAYEDGAFEGYIAGRAAVDARLSAQEAVDERTLWLMRHLCDALGWDPPTSTHHQIWDRAVAEVRRRTTERASVDARLAALEAALVAVAFYRSEFGDYVVRGAAGTNRPAERVQRLLRTALLSPSPATTPEGGGR